ncbi:zinc ABC transporter substrate-binding protein [Shimia biformata]|uniref:zinc ABC transporter substrate-binding protein n=1 Tax=Shimia biformata TaxID=1294299 RepID=UPI00194EF25D|nr:zinc ABC transporter substrate-binding protein [Shimia biformata]
MRFTNWIGVALFCAAGTAAAEVPNVAADIAPVRALVARVMDGVGTPDQVLPANASPHGYSMRPSEAAILEKADLVFWVGPELAPWMGKAVSELASDAVVISLLHQGGGLELQLRTGEAFAEHDHGDDDHGHDEDHHDDDRHDEHQDDHHDADHSHEGEVIDPHAWLDPENGKAWLDVIAENLAGADPENASAYRANARAGQEEIDAAIADVEALLAPVRGVPFVVFHDAYQYFETRFGISAKGSIALGDAADPGPRRVAAIRDLVRGAGVTCVFSEPQFNPKLVRTVTEGSDVGTAVIDPMGAGLAENMGFYPDLIRNIGIAMSGCLGGES